MIDIESGAEEVASNLEVDVGGTCELGDGDEFVGLVGKLEMARTEDDSRSLVGRNVDFGFGASGEAGEAGRGAAYGRDGANGALDERMVRGDFDDRTAGFELKGDVNG